jgi:hypothetical protein
MVFGEGGFVVGIGDEVATSASCVSGSDSGRLIQPLLSAARQLQSTVMSAERVPGRAVAPGPDEADLA